MTEVLGTISVIGEQLACDKGLSWRVEIAKGLPCIWGDRTRLRQVILNLVNNAVKFTTHGERSLTARVDHDRVVVAVSDTGLGIPLHEQGVIFDEFHQSERTTARGYGGLGLGLAICRKLVELHGGEVGVYSSGNEGEGSKFFFSLPVMEVDPGELEALGSFVRLATKLGRLAMGLAQGWPEKMVVAVHGPLAERDTRLLTVAALNGAFQGRVDEAVNWVNAPVIAAERRIEVSGQRYAESGDYTNLLRVVLTVRNEEVEVCATVGADERLFLTAALGFEIDLELAERMVFLVYNDIPGVIGRVGTMCGNAGVNIASMAVSRRREGGKALMAFSIDSEAPPGLVGLIHGAGFDVLRFISLA